MYANLITAVFNLCADNIFCISFLLNSLYFICFFQHIYIFFCGVTLIFIYLLLIQSFFLFVLLQQDCPNGRLTPAKFVDMYKMFFPSGNAEEFCDHVFRTFDMDKNGYIDFKVSVVYLLILYVFNVKFSLKLAPYFYFYSFSFL